MFCRKLLPQKTLQPPCSTSSVMEVFFLKSNIFALLAGAFYKRSHSLFNLLESHLDCVMSLLVYFTHIIISTRNLYIYKFKKVEYCNAKSVKFHSDMDFVVLQCGRNKYWNLLTLQMFLRSIYHKSFEEAMGRKIVTGWLNPGRRLPPPNLDYANFRTMT